MIIIGYPWIGKSSLSTSAAGYIDLESSNFWYLENGNKVRDKNWYIAYCNIAVDLSEQGYMVFVCSNGVVQNRLKEIKKNKNFEENIICCTPTLELKDKWIEKLKNRYNYSQSDKDYSAYIRAADHYKEDVNGIINCGFPTVQIKNMDYSLEKELNNFIGSIALRLVKSLPKYCECPLAPIPLE